MRAFFVVAGLALLVAFITVPTLGHAASGVPNSPSFGYGGRVDLGGQQVPQAINAAAGLGLEWVAVDFDWASLWSDQNTMPNLDALGQAIGQAHDKQISVMISIKNVPAWAMTSAGPDAAITANLVIGLARLYPESFQAVELFPAANTTHGWGTSPNPADYLTLLQTVDTALKNDRRAVLIVAAGLTPLGSNPDPSDMDDLAFLDNLYRLGAAPVMPIVGMRLPEITGEPMLAAGPTEHRVLRHFEEVRQVMRNYDHKDGLIWITGFSWPSGSISPTDAAYNQRENQARWLGQAYQLLKAQLFIGAAFFSQINPDPTLSPAPNSLIQADMSLHPAYTRLSQIITPNGKNTYEIVFSKITNEKIEFKKVSAP